MSQNAGVTPAQKTLHMLQVTITSARFPSTSKLKRDIFVELIVDGKGKILKTEAIGGQSFITWNEHFDVLVTTSSQLIFKIFEKSFLRITSQFGLAIVNLRQVLLENNGKLFKFEKKLEIRNLNAAMSSSAYLGDLNIVLNGLNISIGDIPSEPPQPSTTSQPSPLARPLSSSSSQPQPVYICNNWTWNGHLPQQFGYPVQPRPAYISPIPLVVMPQAYGSQVFMPFLPGAYPCQQAAPVVTTTSSPASLSSSSSLHYTTSSSLSPSDSSSLISSSSIPPFPESYAERSGSSQTPLVSLSSSSSLVFASSSSSSPLPSILPLSQLAPSLDNQNLEVLLPSVSLDMPPVSKDSKPSMSISSHLASSLTSTHSNPLAAYFPFSTSPSSSSLISPSLPPSISSSSLLKMTNDISLHLLPKLTNSLSSPSSSSSSSSSSCLLMDSPALMLSANPVLMDNSGGSVSSSTSHSFAISTAIFSSTTCPTAAVTSTSSHTFPVDERPMPGNDVDHRGDDNNGDSNGLDDVISPNRISDVLRQNIQNDKTDDDIDGEGEADDDDNRPGDGNAELDEISSNDNDDGVVDSDSSGSGGAIGGELAVQKTVPFYDMGAIVEDQACEDDEEQLANHLGNTPLPDGWSAKVSDGGVVMFVNHNDNSVTYQDPRKSLPSSLGSFGVPVDEEKTFEGKMKQFRVNCFSRTKLQHLKIEISRKDMLEDSYKLLFGISPAFLKRRLFICFKGEEGLDNGGVSRDWFMRLSQEFINPMIGLFIFVNNYRVKINPASHINPNHLDYFKAIGRFVAMALLHNYLLDMSFFPAFFKRLLDREFNLDDVKCYDRTTYDSLLWIKTHNIDESDGLELYFNVDAEDLGQLEHFELIKGGDNVKVTESNKLEYIRLKTKWLLTRGTDMQMKAFTRGFEDIMPKKWLQPFSEKELELLLCGMQDIDIKDWQCNTIYVGFRDSSTTVELFWKFVNFLDNAKRIRLFQFITGTCRLPLGGFANLIGNNKPQKFTLEKAGDACRLPMAHTCFNRLTLPPYKQYQTLALKLTFAMEETEGFGHE